MPSYLPRIIAAHRAIGAGRDTAGLLDQARSAPPTRPFREGLLAPGLAVVAEIKRRSPSKGELAPGLVPGDLARSYADGGAACISVLTDAEFFGGSVGDLQEARTAVTLPVLRKDFTVSAADVCDARIMGADAVLLIAAALDDAELRAFRQLAVELEMAALVEVHDGDELGRALDAGADLIGVNQRDLATFEVDRGRAVELRGEIPAGVVTIAESGIRNGADARRLHEAGYDAVLVGEMLVTAPDTASALRDLMEACACS